MQSNPLRAFQLGHLLIRLDANDVPGLRHQHRRELTAAAPTVEDRFGSPDQCGDKFPFI
jgi:hypothetical protein